KPLKIVIGGTQVLAGAENAAGGAGAIKAGYKSQRLDNWGYQLLQGEGGARVNDFSLTAERGFYGVYFSEKNLSPPEKRKTADGWELKWDYQNLVSGFNVALKMPQKLQPGPLAGKISYFAPVSLFFFFFLIFILSTLRGIDLHPMNYFFLAAAFFAFHL